MMMFEVDNENDELTELSFHMNISRNNADKYGAHFIEIKISNMIIWSSFEQIVAFQELNSSTVYVRGDKRLGFKQRAHAEFVFNRFKDASITASITTAGPRRRFHTLSKFIKEFNSALGRSIVKEAKNIMKRRLKIE